MRINLSASACLLFVIPTIVSAQTTFFLDFQQDDQGNPITAGTSNIQTNEPYRNFFSQGVGVRLSTNAPTNHPLNVYNTEGFTLEDDDLERNSGGDGMWEGGSDLGLIVGNALIINRDSTITTPNDFAQGGEMTLNFDVSLQEFGFDFIDLDQGENGKVTFTNTSLGLSSTIEFTDFESGGLYERSGVAFGNRHANRILNLTAAEIGLTDFDEVKFTLTSSGGIGTVYATTIPETSSALLTIIGFSFASLRRKRSLR